GRDRTIDRGGLMTPGLRAFAGGLALLVALGLGYGWGRSSPNAAVAAAGAEASSTGTPPPKLLYYRNPMGLPDTSPVPKKDSMGMDYIAVYEGEARPGSAAPENLLQFSADKVQKLGVRSAPVQWRSLERTLRAAGRIEPDERRQYLIAPKFEGYIERLHVNVTGQVVQKGQPLFEVYSPELVSLQREYAIAVQGVQALQGADSPAQQGMQRLVESSLQRLRNWDISEEQVKALVAAGEIRRSMTYRSPVAGIVTEKKAQQGMRFMPGEVLYQVSDLSSVWLIADVAEQDLGLVRVGGKARVRLQAFPERTLEGTVTYVYPSLKAETRTVPVRVELPNRSGLLKPAMYAQVELPIASTAKVLVVPTSAVIDSGTRQIVLVALGDGRFAPRAVQLGERSEDSVAVRSGLQEGEMVVVAANFLIDAESNLRAAIAGFGSAPEAAGPAGAPAAGKAASSGAVAHHGSGTLGTIDAAAGTLSLSHAPIASLKWPAMTMEFKLAHGALAQGLKPGAKVDFEFVERGAGEWVITAIQATRGAAP
ncbi:MAG: efflux RND transporter periplasmic adaptor subunit, partial [Rhodoferax sp.]